MKKPIFNQTNVQRTFNSYVKHNKLTATLLLFIIASLSFFACSKQNNGEQEGNLNRKGSATTSAQPLPGGRANFSVAIGRFQTSTGQAAWVRMANYTFNAAAGTVNATLHQWASTSQFGKTALNNHTCSVDPTVSAKTCTQYSPTGWIVGGATNPYWNWSGTYTYNTTTGALSISWGTGAVWENWTVTAVSGKSISKLTFVSSSSNYGITHGTGYGSNASWTTYKTINQVPRVQHYGTYAGCGWDGSSSSYSVTNWSTQNQPLQNMGGVTGGNAIHMIVAQSVNACGGPSRVGCAVPSNGKTGIIHHLAGLNNSRAMAYNHHCACLPKIADYPCYNGTIHPYAMIQIIDDAGDYQGMLGIHQQDQPGSVGFSYSVHSWMLQ